jgi:hypothetical protein
MRRLVQVVPSQSQSHEAVLAHALLLGSALERQAGLSTSRLGADALGPRRAGRLQAALSELSADAVLVHYANYAYQPRGCPRWLVDGAIGWRRTRHGGRLVTLFHEVYASGPPWTSAFWLGGLQRSLARRLLGASDAAVTSLPAYRRRLRALGGDAEVLALFSTCGEPERVPGFAERPLELVVFGGVGARERVYGPLRPALETAVRRFGARTVFDVGAPVDAPPWIGEARLERTGTLGAPELSRRLLSARGGLCAHAPGFLAKSSVYAAFAAHGVAPVALGREAPDGSATEPHWWPWAEPEPSAGRLAALAASARQAYRAHDLAAHVRLFGRLLRGEPGARA